MIFFVEFKPKFSLFGGVNLFFNFFLHAWTNIKLEIANRSSQWVWLIMAYTHNFKNLKFTTVMSEFSEKPRIDQFILGFWKRNETVKTEKCTYVK
jgi:hypothetical protein